MNYKHGLCRKGNVHPIYDTWLNMKQRCTNPNSHKYKDYGGRGIKICPRWANNFKDFSEDMFESWKPNLTIERIDNDGDYEPQNCKWIPHADQAKNKRRYGMQKLDWEKVGLIRELLSSSELSNAEIATKFSVSRPTISMIKHNQVWKMKEDLS